MIIIDTHMFIWWINKSPEFTGRLNKIIENNKKEGLVLSVISLWEVAKLVEKERLKLKLPVKEWLDKAINYYNITIIPLTIDIIVKSTQLNGEFHKDPADQIIVATAIILDIPLLTADDKILKYKFVKHL